MARVLTPGGRHRDLHELPHRARRRCARSTARSARAAGCGCSSPTRSRARWRSAGSDVRQRVSGLTQFVGARTSDRGAYCNHARPCALGREDIDRAAEALASRVPTPLHPLARLAYNYRWSWTPGGAELFAPSTPSAGSGAARTRSACCRRRRADALAARRRRRRRCSQRAAALEESIRADLARPARRPGRPAPSARSRSSAPSTASTARCRSTPAASARWPATSSRRPPTARCRWSPSACSTARATSASASTPRAGSTSTGSTPTPSACPPALVTGDDGAPLTVTVPVGDARGRRADLARRRRPRAAVPARRRPPRERRRRRAGSPRGCTSATRDMRLAQYAAARRRRRAGAARRWASSPAVVHLNEGHAAFASLELARRELARAAPRSTTRWTRPARAPSSPPTRRSRPATTPTRAELVARARSARSPTSSASTSTTIVRLGRTHPDDDAEPFGVTQFALRTSRAANGVSRRHGEVAREMWHALWPDRAVDDVPIGHVTNGVHLPTWLGEPMRALLDRHLGEGWLDRAADPATWDGASTTIPDAELWAVRREQRAALVDLRARAQRGRPPRPRRAARVRRGRRDVRPRRADDRLRPPPGHLQAPAPAAAERRAGASTCSPATARSRSCSPARRTRATTTASAARAGPVRGQGRPRDRRPRRLPRRLRPRASARRLVRRLRRLGQPAAPAAGGQRHERDEVGGQRRPAAQRPRRLVGRGLRRRQRLGAVGRRRRRPRRAGRARRRRAPTPARGRGRPRLLRPRRARAAARVAGDDARVAAHQRARSSRPRGCCATTASGSTG